MKIPEKLNICGFKYTVEIRELDDNSLFGQHDLAKCRILIANDVKERQKQEQTLIHEIFHAINIAVGTELEENKVAALSRALYQVLNDNDLFK